MKRLFLKGLKDDLSKRHISLIIGARQVGKTTLIKQLFEDLKNTNKQTAFINLENKRFKALLNENAENVFQLIPPLEQQSTFYLFIDEIQHLDDPSNFLKYLYDEYGNQIKFIVTGSSSFYIDRNFKDSLAGRKRIFELTPLTFEEMLLFKKREDLSKALGQSPIPLLQKEEIQKLFFEYLTYGGYPAVVIADASKEKILILKELADSYAKKDAVEAEIRKPEAYLKLMKVLAERVGNLVNIHSLTADLALDSKTIENYLWLLRKSFHIHYVTPFYRNVSTELKKMPKFYFNDLGLRNYLVSNFEAIGLRRDRGIVLENYVYMKLKESYPSESIKFWRTQKKQEVDFIVSDFFGKSKAIEVKFDKKNIKPKQYRFFAENYPELPLSILDLSNILDFNFAPS